MKNLRIAVDTGGTFTDFVVLDEAQNSVEVFKVSSTRGNESDGILAGLRKYLERSANVASSINYFSHATTVGTNAILEENGARTGLLVTEGFRGIYEVGEQSRPYGAATYDLHYRKAPLLVRPRLTAEIAERVLFDGTVLTPLDEERARREVERLVALGVESIAICLLFAFRNPTHEQRLREIVHDVSPKVNVSISCEIAPQIREYYRLSTTVVNAYLNPLVQAYIEALDRKLHDLGTASKHNYIMRSNGGIATFASAATRSVQTILSGPAAGVVAAARVVAAIPEFGNVVTFDMGGTSADVALIQQGTPMRRMSGKVHGRDVLVPMLDIHTVAAGGGTLAWVDDAGALRVGPESAGSTPGPACYGRGGQLPTITDANLVLGYLSAENSLAGGSLQLDYALAESAIRRTIADPLNMAVIEAAKGIVDIVNVKMQEAIKVVSSNRGYDLRDFHLLAFGGAGPLHASALASELGMKGVIVPTYPGAFSALGLLLSDIRQDYVVSELAALEQVDAKHVETVFTQLRDTGSSDLRSQGFTEEVMRFEYSLDLRYLGQGYELNIQLAAIPNSSQALEAARRQFDEEHRQLTGHAATDESVELVNFRLSAIASVPQAPTTNTMEAFGSALVGKRSAYFFNDWMPTALYDRTKLSPSSVVTGPAILLQHDSTTVVQPNQRATVVASGQIEIRDVRAG